MIVEDSETVRLGNEVLQKDIDDTIIAMEKSLVEVRDQELI